MEQLLARFPEGIGLASGILSSIAVLVTAFWVYIKFVVERGLLPPSDFTVQCTAVGDQGGKTILEILLHIKNLGASTLIVSNLRLDVRYLDTRQEHTGKPQSHDPDRRLRLFDKPEDDRFGTLDIPNSLIKNDLHFNGEILVARKGDIIQHQVKEPRVVIAKSNGLPPDTEIVPRGTKKAEDGGGRGIPVLAYDTFVQRGVDQVYTFITALPTTASYVLVHASFRYGADPCRLERWAWWLARRAGIVQYDLSHITQPHTTERIFNLKAEAKTRAIKQSPQAQGPQDLRTAPDKLQQLGA